MQSTVLLFLVVLAVASAFIRPLPTRLVLSQRRTPLFEQNSLVPVEV